MKGLDRGRSITKPTLGLLGFFLLVASASACSGSGYTASSKAGKPPAKKKNATPESANAAGLPVERAAKVFPGGENLGITFSGDTAVQSAASEAEAWVVTADEVTRIKLDEAAGWPQTKWQMVDENGKRSSSSGHRTYVSELGLLIGRTNRGGGDGGVWLASDQKPGQAIRIYKPSDQGSGSRLSLTSFKIGSQPYIGFAYGTSAGLKKFVRIPIDKSKPNGIDLSRLEEKTFSGLNQAFGGFEVVGGMAAYGSFMDQKSKAFYLGANNGGMWGVNVESMSELSSQNLPNVGIAGRKICNYTMSTTGNIAYALAGDLNGNVVTADNAYTFAHDPANNVVIGSSGSNLTVAKDECVAANGPAECTQLKNQCAVLNPADAGSIGPISAVGDGRVVGIVRGTTSQVFVMSVVDKSDLSKGLTVKKIADIPGNAYMYNDFTGLTLYAPDQIRVIDFNTLKGFQPGKPVKYVAAGWSAASKKAEDLRGLKIEIVCYKKGGSKGAYSDQTKQLSTSASLFVLDPKVCGGDVDTLEVKVSSDGSTNNFSRLSLFEMRGAQ